jgi:RNA polymerase sigma factor (sigma-70 family)
MNATIGQEASTPGSIDRVLVTKVQRYLQQRLRKLAPNAVLTLAWDVFYQTYSEVLRRMAAEFHLDAQEREDLVQEAWSRVIVHLERFHCQENGAGLRGWMYALIRNQALNLIRHKVRHPLHLAGSLEMCGLADPGPSPAQQWQACCDRELMHVLLADLAKKVSPLNHRLAILRWVEGYSLAEVALLLNISEKQVTYRQQRMFRKLRSALAVYRGEPFGANSEDLPLNPARSISQEISEFAPSCRVDGVV